MRLQFALWAFVLLLVMTFTRQSEDTADHGQVDYIPTDTDTDKAAGYDEYSYDYDPDS